MKTSKKSMGFTLVELLVALVIFAVLASLSYRALNSLMQTRSRIEAETTRWREVMLFFNRIDQDLRQHVNRKVRNEDKLIQPPFLGTQLLGGDTTFIFSRLGDASQDGLLADTQRIGYRFHQGSIEEMIWPALDLAPTDKPTSYVVLSHVRQLKLKYMVQKDHVWVDTWPIDDKPENIFPKALAMQIILETGESLNRTFTLQ